MEKEDLHRIYELEAMISRAMGELLKIDAAIKALKPPSPKSRKLTPAQIVAAFDKECEQLRKDRARRHK